MEKDLKDTQLDPTENADEQRNEEELNNSEYAPAEEKDGETEPQVEESDDYESELEKLQADNQNYKEGMLTNKLKVKDRSIIPASFKLFFVPPPIGGRSRNRTCNLWVIGPVLYPFELSNPDCHELSIPMPFTVPTKTDCEPRAAGL